MSGDVERSDLIDTSYADLYNQLSNAHQRAPPGLVLESLKFRQTQLSNITDVFGKPSDASRKKLESGNVTLEDGVTINVGEIDKAYVNAISQRYQIDEIQALVLLRAFFYNSGMPEVSDIEAATDLAEAIGPFFHVERLHSMRILIPLFRARQDETETFYEVAVDLLPKIVPDGPKFAQTILDEYLRKTKAILPERYRQDPKAATTWAKQNLKEQLVLLEVLFWTMWDFVNCSGPLVLSIFQAAYGTNLGSLQANSTLLLDDECRHTIEDCAAVWILITVEVLELENVGEPSAIDFSDTPSRPEVYYASAGSLQKIHDLVTTYQDSQYSITFLAWTYVVSCLTARAAETPNLPPAFSALLDNLNPPINRSYTKDREQLHVQMAKACLEPEVGLLNLLEHLLTQSPLFVTSVAWKQASSVTDPNAIAYRSVMKGLVIALVELQPVELLPDFEAFVEIWIALFGRSESHSVAGICHQFWRHDWHHGIARRAILDVARSRFPVQVKPLLRLLRAMSGSGFLDTDPLYIADSGQEGALSEDRDLCDRFIYHYLSKLPSYTQVIPISACNGPHALYEKQTERFGGTSNAHGAIVHYINLRPIRLPGGSVLPARSSGRLLSGDGGEQIVVCWQHQHSGWKIILEVLTEYVHRRRIDFGAGGTYQGVSFAPRGDQKLKGLRIEEIGMELDLDDDQNTITEALDLVRSLIKENPAVASTLMDGLEDNEPVVCHTMIETQPPDLVQLTTMVLEEALSRTTGPASTRGPTSKTKLITSAISVLSALLAIPVYSNRVWLYIRSTPTLFGGSGVDSRAPGFASAALASERATGQYTMTLALLHLVESLFAEAYSTILPENAKLQQLKEEVLLRAMRFVHTEVWVEHMSWKYAQLGDRFEVGKVVLDLYIQVINSSPPTSTSTSTIQDRPFPFLSQAVADVLLFKGTTSTINPITSIISAGEHMLTMLLASRRYSDVRRLIFLLRSTLRLSRLVCTYKTNSSMASRPCLLEQALCTRFTDTSSQEKSRARHDPIDVLASLISHRDIGNDVPVESARLLTALISSLAVALTSPPAIIGHLSNPDAIVSKLVKIIQHPYEEFALRKAVWNLITLCVDKEPAMARLLVSGKSQTSGEFKDIWDSKDKRKGKEEAGSEEKNEGKYEEKQLEKAEMNIWGFKSNALDAACNMLNNWKELWEMNSPILLVILRFLDVVWQHALEHKGPLEPLRKSPEFWERIVGMASQEVGPVPEYSPSQVNADDGIRRSPFHEGVQIHTCRSLAKSYAIRILTRDIGIHLQLRRSEVPLPKPDSFMKLEPFLKSPDQLTDLLNEAASSSYSPSLHDEITSSLQKNFAGLSLSQLENQEPITERDYGDGFAFSTQLLQLRLAAYPPSPDSMEDDLASHLEKLVLSVNMNLSLAHSEVALVEAWDALLRQCTPYIRIEAAVRPHALAIAASISYDLAREDRNGDMMANIHGARLSLVLALLEVAWFSSSDKKPELDSFTEFNRRLLGIIVNKAQSPVQSILSPLPNPFHRTLLQILFFCSRQARLLLNRPKGITAEQRLAISATADVALDFVIDALRIVFIAARSRSDIDQDIDLELLVAVFEQYVRPDLTTSSNTWLARCQETDIIRASLDLYVHIDLVGLSDVPLLMARKQPLYAAHILLFHMALASNPIAAEKLASDGLLAAYTNNFISSAISTGSIDVVLQELPGQRSPAHSTYCSMLSIVSTVITALGRQNHYFDAEACGFVQLYGDQISRSLSWTIGDSITLPQFEEIDQVVNLFYAIAASIPSAAKRNPMIDKVLRVFTTHSLQLLQQINYAITHPNHLASLYEPISPDERTKAEKAIQKQQDPVKRPIVMHLIHRLFQLSSNIVGTLVVISKADAILSTGEEEWPVHEALVVPHSKIVLGEPASLGTLLELGNRTLDILKNLVLRPPGQGITDPSALPGLYTTALGVKQGVIIARRNLEEILLYSVTQLAMWLSKPDFDNAPLDTEDDPQAMDTGRQDSGRDRRGQRSSLTMAERLRRGMTGEMAGDLQSLLTKSKSIMTASDTIIGNPSVDLTQILLNFLHERINAAS
ncbi:hypothetical protein CPB83DRAFT_781281 [Crepidotus variabilis]|uniref:Nucleoporin Nup188 N-terminal subdomain III domain-containing protein n=1 Tax=Crepidotus variabilis TaxID=179855 RepID=A0A9P6EU88_9AGAR|nr:hypothetical protein CPB83DRAFT_781281 [Crepidotus variabilis]